MKKRLLSLCLAFVMVLAMLPVTALAAQNLSVSGSTVTFSGLSVGGVPVQKMDVYLQSNYAAVSIVSAEMDGNTINVVLAESTDPSAAIQAGFAAAPMSGTLQTTGNKCTLNNGQGTMECTVNAFTNRPAGTAVYTINFTTESSGPAVRFTTDLSTTEVTYTQGKAAPALTVAAEYTGVTANSVTYQWYSYTDSADNAIAIGGATDASYTPATETLGTTCYYAVATCEELTATSSVAKIAVVAPVVRFTTDLSTTEVTYTQGKPVADLTVVAEYTGVTANPVTYQWYSYTESADNAAAIDGANDASYTPATEVVGTTYYYVIVSCEGLTATSSVAKITVVEPVVRFTTDLITAEVTYTQGKGSSALTVSAEYTGVTENDVIYQWYSNSTGMADPENDTKLGEAGANATSYTPSTADLGTTYYYVVATCEGLTATSSVAKIIIDEEPTLSVTDNVIDITDKTVYSWSRYYAKATSIKIIGADVEKATEDGTTVNIVLSGMTNPAQEISVEFGTSLNRCTMSGDKGSVTLSEGKAQLSMTLTGTYVSSLKGSATYTLNFSLGAPPSEAPTRVKESDSAETYTGVAVEFDLSEYFSNATNYYLVEENQNKTPLDGSSYTFKTFTGGNHTLVFAASNDIGDCADYVTVTVAVTEIKSGAWLGIETSNGSVNYVLFKDAEGNEIEGLTATLEGTAVNVSVPRTFAADGKITATFDLTQTNGLPKLSTNNRFNGTNNTKVYTTTLVSGAGKATMYLYNSNPSAVNNNPTTYTINYVIQNEVPVLANGQEVTGTGSITADQIYTLDLDGIFVDPDEGDVITGWKVSINGTAAVSAAVDEENVYSYQTNDAGEYTLVFYGLDNYNALSAETYTVTLTVSNAATTYDVTVNVPEGVEPTFYYTADAQSGTELTADAADNVYTVKVPTNVSVISWRADGAGMSAAVSTESNSLTLVQPTFKVMAEETEDTGATVTVTHANNLVGSNGNYLLLVGIGGYSITATPSAEFTSNWNKGEMTNYTVSGNEIKIPLVSKGVVFTFPYFAELTVSEASRVQGIAPKKVEATKTTGPDYATGTSTATYLLTNGKVYEYRVSVPADNVNCDQYVTYVATFTKKDAAAITVTKEQLESGDNGRTTQDRNLSSNRGRNVADLYSNVNAKGYRNLSVGDEFQLITTRQYWGINADWLMNKNYYYVEPEFHYSVVGLDGVPSTDVIEIDANGIITAKAEGTAIVLVTYDAMTLNHELALSAGALGDYPSTPNDFYGAIWPENTGVYVISVGAADSGITTGMTINEDKTTSQKAGGKALDAELDVIYFIGSSGEYTFTPTGVTRVSIANPTVTGTAMSFTGFVEVTASEDGSYTVPLKAGRNIVKLESAAGAEYQVITAKSVSVTVNGEPLETAAVAPGQKVKIEFNKLFAPVNRMAIYNTACCVVYSEVSGWDGKLAGNARGSYGEYSFAGYAPKHIVEHFVNASTDNSGYSNSQVTTTAELTVPEDFTGEYFTLSGGSFNVGGFMPYLLGSHYEKLGVTPPANTTNENVNCYLGQLPDISIPVATPTSIAVTTQPTKTEYNIGDVFDPAGMVVTANYEGTEVTRPVTGYTYDTAAFTEAGEKQVTITYGQLTTTVTVTVTNVSLEKIEAAAAPTKTLYYIGDRFDPAGMVITATYSDQSTREITDYTYAPETISKDTTAITVTYGSKTVDVAVTVSLVERIEVTTQPTKKSYTEGERFDPAGMVVKAYYTDGSSFETDKYDYAPAGQLTSSDSTITITYNGSEGAASLQPVTVNITVEALQGGDGDVDTPTNYDSITVYMTFVNRGNIVVQDTPVVVYDEDRDGTYRIGDAFRALHRDYYSGGESGYAEISGNGVSGWVSKFWGSGDSTFTYARNHRWASSTSNSIYSGDSIAAINGVDSDFFSDLYTWFDSSSYSALTEQSETFTVNGLNLMGSSASYNALHAPAGATVTVYKSGREVSGMGTTVGTDGSFTLIFDEAGTYTVKISGTAEWGSYTDAPVAPCTCTVYVRENPTPEEKPDETPADTVTPEVEAGSDGEAKVEIGSDAVADAVKQAADEGKGAVVVAPVVKGESDTVTVSLPKDAVDQITADSSLNLTVETPAASVTISNAGLSELIEKQDGAVSISVEAVKDETGAATGEVKVDVAVDGESKKTIGGGVVIAVPAAQTEDTAQQINSNQVLVVVAEDGTETIVAKSITDETGIKALLDGSATVKIVDNSKAFVDVKEDDWFADGVDFVGSREIFQGVGNDVFDHSGTMNRGMMVTVLHRLEDEMEHSYEGTFHDVEEDLWYTDAIHWAADHGLVNGYGDGYFGTTDEITREQMITMTFRYMNWLGLDTSARGNLNAFTDGEEISDWAKEAMEWGIGIGIIEGTGNNLVDPTGDATRAQVAVFMQRVISLMVM